MYGASGPHTSSSCGGMVAFGHLTWFFSFLIFDFVCYYSYLKICHPPRFTKLFDLTSRSWKIYRVGILADGRTDEGQQDNWFSKGLILQLLKFNKIKCDQSFGFVNVDSINDPALYGTHVPFFPTKVSEPPLFCNFFFFYLRVIVNYIFFVAPCNCQSSVDGTRTRRDCYPYYHIFSLD
jgi:hypothetical protein